MRIDIGSLMFNMNLSVGGATCSWGTALGQAEGYRFLEKSYDIIIGITYKKIADIENVSCPLGKGGNKQSDYEFIMAGLFDKIYVNGTKIEDSKFVLLIIKETTGAHIGRKSLKYNQKTTYKNENINEKCFRKIEETFKISSQGAWIIYDISIENQDELHFKACIIDRENSRTFNNVRERKEFIEQEINKLEPTIKIDPSFTNSIEIPVVDSSFGNDIENSKLIEILGNKLKQSREAAKESEDRISTALHVFAIQFAPIIIARNLSCKDIVEVAGVTESQRNEMIKGLNIYDNFAHTLKNNIQKQISNNSEANSHQGKLILDKFKDNSLYKRYITSLLAKPFVILAGISGSGKTKIAADFAKWLKVPNIQNSLLVSVGSDWTDNTKILGYYNSITGKYFKTEIIELIERANVNENIPFFLILDEMNLSRVERYFSDFLSKMEENSDEIYFNLEKYVDENGNKVKLKFPKNLFIIGTVNIDETTYMFSPKVLDRANVIEFTPDNVIENFENDLSAEDIPTAPDGIAESFLNLALSIRQTDILDDSAKGKATDILNKIYNIFEENGKEFGFAYRTVKEIRHYINASIKLGFTDITKAMDEQVLQKILPKIHGNRKQLEILLEKLKTTCDENDLTSSSNKIVSMQQKLSTNQFASFI